MTLSILDRKNEKSTSVKLIDFLYMDMHFIALPVKKTLSRMLLYGALLYSVFGHTGEAANIAVIYPDIREPYLTIFKEIKLGIDDSLNEPAVTIVIDKETTTVTLEARLNDSSIDAVITLGNSAYQYAGDISVERAVVSGAVFTRPDEDNRPISSISMLVSPKAQFIRLSAIAPAVTTIYVVYNPEQDQWLIDRAMLSLEGSNITLKAIASNSLKESAAAYQQLIEKQQLSAADALWLMQGDKAVGESSILSRILQQAWNKQFVVFSSNPAHVKRGALFATYPNNKLLGEKLGQKIIGLEKGRHNSVEPLVDLKVAFNKRTAEHLELNISRSKQQTFDLIFPNR